MKVKSFIPAILLLGCLVVGQQMSGVTLTTLDGEQHTGFIKRVEPDGIVLQTSDGVPKIKFKNLPSEVAHKYGYDASTASLYTVESQNAEAEAFANSVRLKTQQDAEAKRKSELVVQAAWKQTQQPAVQKDKPSGDNKSMFQLERTAENHLEEAMQPQFSDSPFRNASVAAGIARAVKEMAELKGGKPENYIPQKYRFTDKEALIKKAIEEGGDTPRLMGYAVSQNPNAQDANRTLDMAVMMAAQRNHDVHIYSAAEISANPGIPLPAVTGEIKSVMIYGNQYEVKTADGVTHKGGFEQRIDSNGNGSTTTFPSGSSEAIMTIVTPTHSTIIQ